jgi:hypothetical protein
VANPDIDPARLREFLAIGRELEADQAKREYVEAFMQAKRALDGVKITKHGKIVYPAKREGGTASTVTFARYEDIADAIKPKLAESGLAASYSYEYTANPPKVICVMTLTHLRGHSQEFRSVPLPMVDSSGGKNDIQGAGSISSYGRRYVVCPAFDIVTEEEDNDGTGKGSPVQITEEQIRVIEDMVQACTEKDPLVPQSFPRWLKAEFAIDSPAKLYQGPQLEAVMGMLKRKLRP